METKTNKKNEMQKPQSRQVKRFYKGEEVVDSDLFKLQVASFRKKISIDGEKPARYENAEHCHYFHTYDSNGRPMNKASSVGGHTHTIVWEEVGDEFFARCSTPEPTNAFKKGKFQDGNDLHTHTVKYIRSSRVKASVMSGDAQKEIDKYNREFSGVEKL